MFRSWKNNRSIELAFNLRRRRTSTWCHHVGSSQFPLIYIEPGWCSVCLFEKSFCVLSIVNLCFLSMFLNLTSIWKLTHWAWWLNFNQMVRLRLLVENWIDAWKRLFSDKVPLLLHFLKFYLLTSKVSSHLVSKEGHKDSVTSSLTSTQMLMSRPLLHNKERKKNVFCTVVAPSGTHVIQLVICNW